MKTKVIGIQPAGATISRINGTNVGIGDEIAHEEAVTLTMPHGTKGGSIQFGAGATVAPRVTERLAPPRPPIETDNAAIVTNAAGPSSPSETAAVLARLDAPPALVVSDGAAPARVDARRSASPPAVKVNL